MYRAVENSWQLNNAYTVTPKPIFITLIRYDVTCSEEFYLVCVCVCVCVSVCLIVCDLET